MQPRKMEHAEHADGQREKNQKAENREGVALSPMESSQTAQKFEKIGLQDQNRLSKAAIADSGLLGGGKSQNRWPQNH